VPRVIHSTAEDFLRKDGATPRTSAGLLDRQRPYVGRSPGQLAFVALSSYLILFIWMPLYPYMYDEGIVLTAAMRVAAGQVPHRDFYANYGPAQFYILAGLFKLFGESLLIERLYDLLIKALLVTSVYYIVRSYCRRSIAVCTCLITILWLIGINMLAGAAQIPVSLLNVIAPAFILPVFVRSVSTKRMFAAGAVVGLAELFRYECRGDSHLL
jgi:hypothetical protein